MSADGFELETSASKLLDFELTMLTLPVAPGRNVASLVEVAARNYRLQQEGRSGAAELEDRVWDLLRRGES